MATGEALYTAEEFALLPDDGQLSELVRGRIVPLRFPAPRHGEICTRVCLLLGNFLEQNGLRWVLCAYSGIVTERDPDTVRGADLSLYSCERVPEGKLPEGYLAVAPELVFEVRSPEEPWPDVQTKVAEFLRAGVEMVYVVDDESKALRIYQADGVRRELTADEDLTLPKIFGDLRVKVRRFFE